MSNCVSEKIDYIKKASEEAKITNMRIIRSSEISSNYDDIKKDVKDIELILSTLYRRHRVSSIKELTTSQYLKENEIINEYRFALNEQYLIIYVKSTGMRRSLYLFALTVDLHPTEQYLRQ